MIKIIFQGISFIILIIIGYGAVKYIETQQAIRLMDHGTKTIKKVISSQNYNLDLSKLNTINLPRLNTERKIKDKVWVNGKTLKECMNGTNEINNNHLAFIRCAQHYV